MHPYNPFDSFSNSLIARPVTHSTAVTTDTGDPRKRQLVFGEDEERYMERNTLMSFAERAFAEQQQHFKGATGMIRRTPAHIDNSSELEDLRHKILADSYTTFKQIPANGEKSFGQVPDLRQLFSKFAEEDGTLSKEGIYRMIRKKIPGHMDQDSPLVDMLEARMLTFRPKRGNRVNVQQFVSFCEYDFTRDDKNDFPFSLAEGRPPTHHEHVQFVDPQMHKEKDGSEAQQQSPLELQLQRLRHKITAAAHKKFKGKMQLLFKKFDVNNDGSIERKELEHVIKDLLPVYIYMYI